MRTFKKSMLMLGSVAALGSFVVVAAPAVSHAASPCAPAASPCAANPCAANPCAANPCAAKKHKFSRYGKR